MTSDAINILPAMADNRWRTISEAAIKAGLTEPGALAAMKALAADCRLNRERVTGISIYQSAKGADQ